MEHWENTLLDSIDGEIWKPIIGYESLYEISNYGRLKSIKHRKDRDGYKRYYKILHRERIRKLQKNVDGYIRIDLWKDQSSMDC